MSVTDLMGVVVTLATTTPKPDPWYLNPGLIALMGTLFGGAGLKAVEKLMSRNQEKRAEKQVADRDYRGEITELVNRMDKLEQEVTFWRNRFYEEQEHNAVLRIFMINQGLQPPMQVAKPPSEQDVESQPKHKDNS